VIFAFLLLLCVGCAGPAGQFAYKVPVIPPPAFIYEHFKAPVQTDMDETRLGSKVGTASTRYLREPIFTQIPVIAWGDASIETAAKNGGINTIRHVDYEVTSVLYAFIEFTTIVYGD
jgi:hypothetical protein